MNLYDFYKESPTKHKTRQGIINAAIDLFAENGMEAVSMTDIGKESGTTPRNLYRYYASKDLLVMDAAFQVLGQTRLKKYISNDKLKGLEQLNIYLNEFYNVEIADKNKVKQFKFIMYFDLYIFKLEEDNIALKRYINLYRKHINNTGYAHLTKILEIGLKDKSINIVEEEIEFYTIFIIQTLISIMMRTMIKETENNTINGFLVTKQIDMIIDYLKA